MIQMRRMDEHIHIHMHLTSIVTMCWLVLLTTLPHSYCDISDSVCAQPYNCGTLSKISYPFWGLNQSSSCGGGVQFQLTCHDNDNTTSIQIDSQNYTVKEINMKARTMRVVRTDLARNVCSPQFEDTYLSPMNLFQYASSVYNITIFYNCSSSSVDTRFGNFTCGHENALFYDGVEGELLKTFPWLDRCGKHVQVPVDVPYDNNAGHDFLKRAFTRGFLVNYIVDKYDYSPSTLGGAVLTIVGSGSAIIVGGFVICIMIWCRKFMSSRKVKFCLPLKNDKNIEAFLKDHGALAQRRYKFSEVKKMTSSFKVKLGQGGFGAVYKGELLSGCPVAVKILNASKGNCEDFINEVASISKTSHVNVVTLLGFCLEGHKKALIYEFMPNGSLDKFINKGLESTTSLSWDNLWQIAIGIARGLEYLHRGCNTRILHFDIKPHNILLDENFCPKISDFGLAKLCPRNESIISMSDQRGTIGYVAPEVCNKHFGGISHKSDVYSYGMMLLEMVGVRKNINAESSHTSEIYFPDWIYSMLEEGGDLRPDGVIATEKKEIARRMTIVGLWCVQTFPKDRPTMSRVIDMLEGNMNSLEMPPKPVLSSLPSLVPESTTGSSQLG